MMRPSVLAVALLATGLLQIGVTPAQPLLPEDQCTNPPEQIRVLGPAPEGEHRVPQFVADHVWYGNSVYLPDGTLVGPAPAGTLRGEVPTWLDDILDPSGATWGVVVDTDPGAKVFAPAGTELFELPISTHAEAIYTNDVILVSDWGAAPPHLSRTLLVEETGEITELANRTTGWSQRYGAVLGERIYFVKADGGLATFDLNGTPLDLIEPSTGFRDLVSTGKYLYATEDTFSTDLGWGNVLWIFDAAGRVVNKVDLGGRTRHLGATTLIVAADVATDNTSHAVVMAPNGTAIKTLDRLNTTAEAYDSLAWQHGRYLIGINSIDDREHTATIQIELYGLDGIHRGTSASFDYSTYPDGLVAGKVMALVPPSRQKVDFRTLDGTMLGTEAYGSTATPEVEALAANDDYIWVTTNDGLAATYTTHVYSLGDCSGLPEPGRFLDDDRSLFESDIEWLAESAIAYGCNPSETNTKFCPNNPLTRGQMAALLHRALGDSIDAAGPPIAFDDTADSVFSADIDWLSSTGITVGCSATEFCPEGQVTRGHMAAFLVRALDLPATSDPLRFDDDDGHIFEDDIASLAAAGITTGCDLTRYCPDRPLTRGQAAAFLYRALGA